MKYTTYSTLVLESKDGVDVTYLLKDILDIHYDMACNIYDAADIRGNELKPCEVVMVINFTNGTQSTFSACNWVMRFEE